MATVIEEFFISLGFDIESGDVEKFNSALSITKNAMVAVVAAAGAAALAVTAFVDHVAEGLDELGDFAEINNVSAQYLQEMGYAAQLSGSNLEAVKSTVEGLNASIGQAANGVGRAATIFKQLGLSAKDAQGNVKSIPAFLDEIATKIAPLSRQQQIGIVGRLGISPTLIPLLLKGKEGIAALRAEAREFGVVNEAGIKTAGAYVDELDRMRFAFQALKDELAVGIIPQLQPLIEGARKWLVQNRALITSGIQSFLSVVGNTMAFVRDMVVKVADGFAYLIEQITGVKDSSAGMAAAIAAVLAAIFPAQAAFAALATLIVLIIDDIQTMRDGGDSLIGTFLDQVPELVDLFKTLWEAIKPIASGIWDLAKIIGSALVPVLRLIGIILGGVFRLVTPLIKGVVFLIGKIAEELLAVATGLLGPVADAVKFVFGWIVDFIDSAREKVTDTIEAVVGAYQKVKGFFSGGNVTVQGGLPAKAGPIGRSGGLLGIAATPSNETTTTNNTTLNLGGMTVVSPSPAQAGVAVHDKLREVSRTASRNGQSAVEL